MNRNGTVALVAGAVLTFVGVWIGLTRPWVAGISLLPGFALLSAGAWIAAQGMPRDEETGRFPTYWRNGLLTVMLVALFTAVAFWVSLIAVVSADTYQEIEVRPAEISRRSQERSLISVASVSQFSLNYFLSAKHME